jgi:[acyl-carrier-protein] S-malonyltransferase
MATDKNLAFVFPGQGSQAVGMVTALAEEYPDVRTCFGQASEILGYNLWDLVHDGPEHALNSTAKTQPALLVTSVAIWNLWQQKTGPLPLIMAGHSLGEYTALVCAGVLNFTDAVALVADRGRYMQAAVPEGTGSMAAILGLDNEQIKNICEQAAQGEIVSAANYNSTGQIVIAGHAAAVKRAVELAKNVGARKSIILPVSVPSHCALMESAARKLADRMNRINFKVGNIPVIHNVDVSKKTDPAAIKQAMAEQLYKPVHWVKTIEMMKKQGITRIVECGPGKVLSGLIKRIDRTIETLPVYDPESLTTALSV